MRQDSGDGCTGRAPKQLGFRLSCSWVNLHPLSCFHSQPCLRAPQPLPLIGNAECGRCFFFTFVGACIDPHCLAVPTACCHRFSRAHAARLAVGALDLGVPRAAPVGSGQRCRPVGFEQGAGRKSGWAAAVWGRRSGGRRPCCCANGDAFEYRSARHLCIARWPLRFCHSGSG